MSRMCAVAAGRRAAEEFSEYVSVKGHAFLRVDAVANMIAAGPDAFDATERAFAERLTELAAECMQWRRLFCDMIDAAP